MTWTAESQLQALAHSLAPHLSPSGSLLSLAVVGSMASGRATADSDIDLLMITSDDPSTDDLTEIGRVLRAGLAASFPNEAIVLFDSPAQNRPDLATVPGRSVQILLHRIGWVQDSLAACNWVFMSWARNHKTLIGKDILQANCALQLNDSILDEFDGLPSVLRRIDAALLVVDLAHDERYIAKLVRYACARMRDLSEAFPELGTGPYTVPEALIPLPQLVAQVRDDLKRFICNIRAILHRGSWRSGSA